MLGYDVFNPLEVVPEFTADVGIKKGEKIDYAIVRGGEVQILIECKRTADALRIEHASQLFRYFAATNARVAVLTNGEVYQFYTDLDAPNRMDAKAFLILDLNDIDETLIPELMKLSKRVRDQFTGLVAKATRQFLSDQVNDRLKAALRDSSLPTVPDAELAASVTSEPVVEEDLAPDGVSTTFEELEGFQIIRAIVCSEVKPHRVVHRDAKSYFAVLLDDNNRRTIARLHFNRSQKYLGLFDTDKVETRHPISTLDEIYEYAEQLRQSVRRYQEAPA